MSDTPRTEQAIEDYMAEQTGSDTKLLQHTLKCFMEENAELRKDKARLDWLLNRAYTIRFKGRELLISRLKIDQAIEEGEEKP